MDIASRTARSVRRPRGVQLSDNNWNYSMTQIRWTHRLAGTGMLGLILTWMAATAFYAVGHRIPRQLPWCAGASLFLFVVAFAVELRKRP